MHLTSAPCSIRAEDLKIQTLGTCEILSPINAMFSGGHGEDRFVDDAERVFFDNSVSWLEHYQNKGLPVPTMELAGPRKKIFFNPKDVKCAIVTCGGLCPGLNDVIRSLVMQGHYRYGIKKFYGIRYGYEGFIESYGHEPLDLTPEVVANIQDFGGSILGSSRGKQDTVKIVDWLVEHGVSVLFVIGGDGTLRGAMDLCQEIERRGKKISVIGIPKTIDNDLLHIDTSFGFETAFAEAEEVIRRAHVEAIGAPNGVGLVKLMGRHSGFIACYATLARSDVNFTLIPESPFKLDGPNGFLEALRKRMEARKHAVIVVAEGAGQDLIEGEAGKDASGNAKLKDIGSFLKQKIQDHFKKLNVPLNLKYFDPSYLIRSVQAHPSDSVFCSRLAQHAVHAAMSGKTNLVIGRRLMHYVHLPIDVTTCGRQQVDVQGDLWLSVVESTGQPIQFV